MFKARERTRLMLFGIIAAVLVCSTASAAPTFGFTNITGNNPANALIGENQLSVELIDFGGGQVEFLFRNIGPDPATIMQINFDDGDTSSISLPMGFTDITGIVSFSDPVNGNENLPGGNTVGFETTTGFSADADTPQPVNNGISPGETLGITLTGDYSDVLADMLCGDLVVGIHVQSIGVDRNSESFITDIPVVPAPSAIALGIIGIGMVRNMRKRKTL